MGIEPGEIPFQGALPGAEDVLPLSTNDPTDKLSAVAKTTDDLFYRHIVLRQREDRGVDLFPPLVTFVLQVLGGSEQLRIDRRRANSSSDLAHRFAYGIEKSATGILHQVPTINDLGRLRKRPGNSFTVSAAAVTSDNGNLLMPFEPGCGRCRLTIRQQCHRPMAFEVANNRSIALVPAPRPIVDADDIERLSRYVGSSAYDTEQRVVAHRQQQSSGKACCRTSAQRETEMMHDAIEPSSSSRRWRQNVSGETLCEDLPAAQHCVAPKAARNDYKLDAPSVTLAVEFPFGCSLGYRRPGGRVRIHLLPEEHRSHRFHPSTKRRRPHPRLQAGRSHQQTHRAADALCAGAHPPRRMRLFDIKCACFDEEQYCECFPRALLNT